MEILGAINHMERCYNLQNQVTSTDCGIKLRSMTLVKRYLRWGLLGLIFLLTASAPMLCVVIDNDDDNDPTTGTIVEFSIISCKEIRAATSMVQAHSNRTSEVVRVARPKNWSSKQLEEVRRALVLLAPSESFPSPLRC